VTHARTVEGGTCHVFVAFEAAVAIDLDAAERRVRGAGRAGLAAGERNAGGADIQPRPLRLSVECAATEVAGHASLRVAQATLFDFGAISVRLDIPLRGDAAALPALARALAGNSAFRAAARDVAAKALDAIGDAAQRPSIADGAEDYAVFALPPVSADPRDGLPEALVARILRAEEGELAAQEVADAAAAPVCYSPADAAFVDWNGALVVDARPHEALAVLEFANVELVEMRWLDDRLDRALDAAHRAAADSLRGPRILAVQTGRQARRIAELQLDAAALFESVNNALKLFGDQWLARLHGAATRRMHIDDFERSVLRKLQALDSIYGKVRDRQVQVRAEILEWIIIVLIAAEILLFLK
jgi:hypothetical protein